MPAATFDFVKLTPGTVELGWRFDDILPKEASAAMSAMTGDEDFRTSFFSPRRTVSLAPFQIATRAVPWDSLFDNDDFIDTDNMAQACERVDAQLAPLGWRLPTEDELEAAAGGALFFWGNVIPEGIPYAQHTTFTQHHEKNEHGLMLNDDPYRIELVRSVCKMGDGGFSICGGEPWPIAWLALSPAYRTPDELLRTAWEEYLETIQVRPVLL